MVKERQNRSESKKKKTVGICDHQSIVQDMRLVFNNKKLNMGCIYIMHTNRKYNKLRSSTSFNRWKNMVTETRRTSTGRMKETYATKWKKNTAICLWQSTEKFNNTSKGSFIQHAHFFFQTKFKKMEQSVNRHINKTEVTTNPKSNMNQFPFPHHRHLERRKKSLPQSLPCLEPQRPQPK